MAINGYGSFLQLQTAWIPSGGDASSQPRPADDQGDLSGSDRASTTPEMVRQGGIVPLLSDEHRHAFQGAPIAVVELASAFRLLQIVFEYGGFDSVAKAASFVLSTIPVRVLLPAAHQIAVRLFADAPSESKLPLDARTLATIDRARGAFLHRLVPALLSKMLARRPYGTLPALL